jgi:hypothetical protein
MNEYYYSLINNFIYNKLNLYNSMKFSREERLKAIQEVYEILKENLEYYSENFYISAYDLEFFSDKCQNFIIRNSKISDIIIRLEEIYKQRLQDENQAYDEVRKNLMPIIQQSLANYYEGISNNEN